MTEAGEAKRDGANLQRNSGRGIIEKGDATLGPFCIDYKEYRDGFNVTRKVWAKATSDAWRSRKQPALKLVLGDEENTRPTRLWVVGDSMFHEMLEAWEEKNGNTSDEA